MAESASEMISRFSGTEIPEIGDLSDSPPSFLALQTIELKSIMGCVRSAILIGDWSRGEFVIEGNSRISTELIP